MRAVLLARRMWAVRLAGAVVRDVLAANVRVRDGHDRSGRDGSGPVSTTKWRRHRKIICAECGSVTSESAVLRAVNPFNPEYALLGCPNCKAVDQFRVACTAIGCRSAVTMGMPHEDGVYRSTCSKHGPEFLR